MKDLEVRFYPKKTVIVDAKTEKTIEILGCIQDASELAIEVRKKTKEEMLRAGSFLALYSISTAGTILTAVFKGGIESILPLAGAMAVFDAPHRILDFASAFSRNKYYSRLLKTLP